MRWDSQESSFSVRCQNTASAQPLCLLIDLADTGKQKGTSQGHFTGLNVFAKNFRYRLYLPQNTEDGQKWKTGKANQYNNNDANDSVY